MILLKYTNFNKNIQSSLIRAIYIEVQGKGNIMKEPKKFDFCKSKLLPIVPKEERLILKEF